MLRDYEPNFFYLIQLCCGYVFSEIWLIVTLNILWHTWNKLRRNDSVFLFPLLCLCMMCLRKLWLGPVSFWWLSAIFRCGTRAERGWPISGHGSVDSSWSMIRADGKELEIDDPPGVAPALAWLHWTPNTWQLYSWFFHRLWSDMVDNTPSFIPIIGFSTFSVYYLP